MRLIGPIGLATAALLGGCSFDPDQDGLRSGEERDLGLDPKVADSDADGLNDGDEITAGSDPLLADTDADGLLDGEELPNGADPTNPDTDGDTYLDGHEVAEGKDPADETSRIYKGYWPYNPDKDALGDGDPFDGNPAAVGAQFPRYADGRDQFDQRVDLYDFAGRSLVVLDGSANWCGPCQAAALWLANIEDPYGYEAEYKPVRKAVDRGEVSWVTVLTDGWSGTADASDVEDWDTNFPNERVPVLTDPNGDVLTAINYYPEGGYLAWPSFVVLDAEMNVVYRGGAEDTLAFVKANQ